MGETYLNLINGQWTAASSGRTQASYNPAQSEEVVGYYPLSEAADLESAVSAAREAKLAWRRLGSAARGEYLYRAAQILESRLEEIARTMTDEMGKSLPEARGETARGVAILRYYAGEGMRKVGDVIPSTDSEALMYTTRVPLGVVGVITPWNFPVAIPIWKIAPALVYGNTVVFKPASETAITAAKVVECLQEAGFPAGVLNFITGSGSVIGQGLVEHAGVEGITFTGSDTTGRQIGLSALARGAKYQLEMGGKNPVIVAADADLDLAADGAISGAYKSTGQKCTATSRILVDRKVYETFREKMLQRLAGIKVGNGLDSTTWMGPLASRSQLDTVLSYIDKGKEEGASIIFGGERLRGDAYDQGFYVQPTLFDQVDNKMAIAQEEIFGPVAALIPFDTLEEAIALANDVKFGLSASIYTRDIGSILRFTQDMEAGLVRINSETAGVELQAPFGGMKLSSSHSREQGQAAVEFFTSIKTVFVKP